MSYEHHQNPFDLLERVRDEASFIAFMEALGQDLASDGRSQPGNAEIVRCLDHRVRRRSGIFSRADPAFPAQRLWRALKRENRPRAGPNGGANPAIRD